MNEDLRDWFGKGKKGGAGGGGWDRYNTKGERIGKCAREPGEPKPKCLSKEKAAKMGKEKIAAAVRRKRAKDPVADREGKGGKPKMVSNKIDEVRNAYAVGMAVAKKKYNDEPPLEKKTIKKAHEIAKSIKRDEKMEEAFERFQRLGKNYKVFFTFRGQYKSLDFFFPTAKRPSREDVKTQLHKIYPEAVLVNYFEREREEDKPVVHVEGAKSFGQFRSDSQQLNEFLPGTGRVVAGRSQRGANPAGGSRFTTAGTVQKVFGVTIPGSFRKGVSQSDVDRHNRRAPSNAQIRPTNQSDDQLMGIKPGGQRTVGITPDPRPRTPTRTASQSRAQSSSGAITSANNNRLRQAQRDAADVGNATGTSGLMRSATRSSNNMQRYYDRLRQTMRQTGTSGADQNMNLRGVPMRNSYEPESEMVEQATYRQRSGTDMTVPSDVYQGRPDLRRSLELRGSDLSRQDRRYFKSGGGYARMQQDNQTMQQVVDRGRKNQERLSSKQVNTANWTDEKGRKVYAGNPTMRFNTQKNSYEPEGETIDEKSAAWTREAGKNKEGGLNEKGRKSYERENPGSDLKAPSKVKGNPRRKSFCARMKGMKNKLTSAKTANDPDSRINKSLRAWDC